MLFINWKRIFQQYSSIVNTTGFLGQLFSSLNKVRLDLHATWKPTHKRVYRSLNIDATCACNVKQTWPCFVTSTAWSFNACASSFPVRLENWQHFCGLLRILVLSLFSRVLVFDTALSDNGLFNIEFYCKITKQKLTVIGMNRTKRGVQFCQLKRTWPGHTHSPERYHRYQSILNFFH